MTLKQFKALQAKWYKKLTDNGFKDAEDEHGNLKEYHSKRLIDERNLSGREEKQRFFELARQMLHSHPFPSDKHKKAWAMFSEGHPKYKIAKELGIPKLALDKFIAHMVGHIREND
jgi:hypothetical protein